MLAVERTTKLFVRSLEQAGVNFKISIEKSRTAFGQSNYVLIRHANALKFWKVRISDLHIPAGAKPSSWAVWMGMLVREHASQKADA